MSVIPGISDGVTSPAEGAEEEQEPQEAEKCPCCKESNLSYGESGLSDGPSYFYKWTCNECGATGTEWFDLVFSEHIIKTPGTPSEAAA